MNNTEPIDLTDAEKTYLLQSVRQEIARRLGIETAAPQRPPQSELTTIPPEGKPALETRCGAFVTLHTNGRLRGCIGYIEGIKPLEETIREMAEASAFRDPRFPSFSAGEWEALEVEISVLTPLQLCKNPETVTVGTHGLYIRRGGLSGLLLPQVPLEQGWDRETFLNHTCLKAGLPPDSWRKKDAELFTFTALVFSEDAE